MINRDIRYIIKRIIIGVGIVLLLSFIRTCEVKALEISDFDDLSNIHAMNTPYDDDYTATPDDLTGVDIINRSVSNLNIDVSNNKYTIIPIFSAWYLAVDRVCYWGPSNVGQGAYTAGGCSLVLNNNVTWRVVIFDENNNGHYCSYNGVYAICNTSNVNAITKVQITFYYTFDNISIGGQSMNTATASIKLATRINDYWYIANATSQENQINQAIQDQIQAEEENTNKIIENQQVCEIIDKNKVEIDGKGLLDNGTLLEVTNSGITKYIKIDENTKITQLLQGNWSRISTCFYNINKELISCVQNVNITTNVNIPQNSSYFRTSIQTNSNKPQFKVCRNGNQATNDAINDTNDTLKDSSIDDPTNDLNDMTSNEVSNSVISDLLLLPVTLFQNIVNSINGTCTSFNLGSLFGTSLILPCIDISSLIGSQLWGVIDVLFCGIFILSIRKKFVDIFENITSLKDRGNELE